MKFNPTSETARQEVLEYAKTQMTKKDAMQFLADLGYYTDVLWNIEDVTDHYKCTDEEAYEVLRMVLSDAYIKSVIREAIHMASEQLNLEQI